MFYTQGNRCVLPFELFLRLQSKDSLVTKFVTHLITYILNIPLTVTVNRTKAVCVEIKIRVCLTIIRNSDIWVDCARKLRECVLKTAGIAFTTSRTICIDLLVLLVVVKQTNDC